MKKATTILLMTLFLFAAQTMYSASEQAKGFLKQSSEGTGSLEVPIDDLRKGWAEFGASFPELPKNAKVIETTINGIKGEWVYAPGSKKDKVLVQFHGGGYAIGFPSMYRQMNYLLSKAGKVRVFSVDYRLAPENPYPAGANDCLAVYEGLLKDGYLPENIAFTGDSAGGGLVFQVLLLVKEKNLPMPAAGIPMSPWVDLTNSGESITRNAMDENPNGRDPMVSKSNLNRMADWYLNTGNEGAFEANDPRVSPIFADLTGLPPIYLCASSIESLYSDSLTILDRLTDADVNTVFEITSGVPHVWPTFPHIIPEGRATISRIGSFLKDILKIK